MFTPRWGIAFGALAAALTLGAGSEGAQDPGGVERCRAAQLEALHAANGLAARAEELRVCALRQHLTDACHDETGAADAAQWAYESTLEAVDHACKPDQTLHYDGARVYRALCSFCHDDGLVGAPRRGDVPAWRARRAKGRERLVQNVLAGHGQMPSRHARRGFSDEQVRKAVEYLVDER